jgi:hypothetical protein
VRYDKRTMGGRPRRRKGGRKGRYRLIIAGVDWGKVDWWGEPTVTWAELCSSMGGPPRLKIIGVGQ